MVSLSVYKAKDSSTKNFRFGVTKLTPFTLLMQKPLDAIQAKIGFNHFGSRIFILLVTGQKHVFYL